MRRSNTPSRLRLLSRATRRLACLALAFAIAGGASLAQEAPFNASEVGNFDQPGQIYADVWGDGDFAYVGHSGQRVVDIVDISDPANPVLAATYDTGVTFASAQDVKVGDGLMFVGTDSSAGCQIVDVRDPYMPVKLTDVTVAFPHNVFYDEGWLYLVESFFDDEIYIVDLTSYDPDNPPATISTARWRVTDVGQQVHDITVQNGRLYASAWDRLGVYDVSDVANTLPSLLGSVPGDNVHAAWATGDGRFVVATEEKSNSGLHLYEIIDNGSSVTLEARDYYFISSLRSLSVHNVVIDGYRVYISWYAAGVQVFDIDPETAKFTLVASFDTTPADGDDGLVIGNWGVYPLLGPAKVLASDRFEGLFVIDVDANVLRFKYPTGVPDFVLPGGPAPISVEVEAIGSPPLASSVMRHAAVDGGMPAAQTLTPAGGDLFSGTLPSASCGSVIEVSFSAENLLGTPFVDPPGAPAETYRVDIAEEVITVFEDTFDFDNGWTVTNSGVSAGAWERGDPIGTGAQPEFDATGDVAGACFFTGQGVIGGDIDDDDLDGGPTVLTSPPMDLSAGGGIVNYAYWFFNNDEDSDALVVEVSDDGVLWVEARRYDGLFGGWREDRFDIADFITPGAQTQVRFSVADNPNNSVTEAAIDNFSVVSLICGTWIFADGFESGDASAWSSVKP